MDNSRYNIITSRCVIKLTRIGDGLSWRGYGFFIRYKVDSLKKYSSYSSLSQEVTLQIENYDDKLAIVHISEPYIVNETKESNVVTAYCTITNKVNALEEYFDKETDRYSCFCEIEIVHNLTSPYIGKVMRIKRI